MSIKTENEAFNRVYQELEILAEQIRLEAVAGKAPLYYTFSDSNIKPPATSVIDAVLRRLVIAIERVGEAQADTAYGDGKEEGYAKGYEDGYDEGFREGSWS